MASKQGGGIILGLMALGGLAALIYYATRDRQPQQQPAARMAPRPSYGGNPVAPHWIPEPMPAPSLQAAPSTLHANAYQNEEVREITYNEEGLPVKIVIHRNAKAG